MNPQNQLQDLASKVLITSAFGLSYLIIREQNNKSLVKNRPKHNLKTGVPYIIEVSFLTGFSLFGWLTCRDALWNVSHLPEIDDKDTSGENNEEKNECSS